MIRVAILAIGSELLEGSIVDTNTAWLGSVLSKYSTNIRLARLVPDDFDLMVKVIQETMAEYDLVLTTGGLGPTFDDLTAEAVAKATGRNFVLNDICWQHILKRLTSFGVNIKPGHERQAFLPEGCDLYPNENGTAYGFGVSYGNSYIVSMPGIPYEMKTMFTNKMLPYLVKTYGLQKRFTVDLRFGGAPESDVDAAVLAAKVPSEVECIINVAKGECLVKLRSLDERLMRTAAERVRDQLADKYIGEGDESAASVMLRLLGERGLTLATAESCTGGWIGREITSVPGSSSAYPGGVVSYSDSVKVSVLGVSPETIKAHGAVSAECAEEMVNGVCRVIGTPCGIAVTGIAGPGGERPGKPVGTVFIAVKHYDDVRVSHSTFPGDRESVRERTVKVAIRMMNELLKEKSPVSAK